MNRNLGLEKQLGLGGGAVSSESQAALEKAESYSGSKKRKPKKAAKAVPYLLKALKDRRNLDALIQTAFLHPLPDAIDVLEYAESVGSDILKGSLGQDCFSDTSQHVGRFWHILETRPYMRVLQAQVRVYFENKQFSKSAETITEMLRLCPGDNLGQRFWAGSVLLHANRPSDALSFAQVWLHPLATERGMIPPRGGTEFLAPSSEPMTNERYQQLQQWCKGCLAYTSALASFKLWGNCTLACQYLAIGVAINPIILTKILARAETPSTLNNNARSLMKEGAEDAQDYLWLTQSLWMTPDVWEWANSNADVKASLLKICSRVECKATEKNLMEFKQCSQCKEVFYCGQNCQRLDWRNHKSDCTSTKNRKELIKSYTEGKSLPPNAPIFAADVAEV